MMRAKKIVNQSSDFPVRRTGSYRHKKSTDDFFCDLTGMLNYDKRISGKKIGSYFLSVN